MNRLAALVLAACVTTAAIAACGDTSLDVMSTKQNRENWERMDRQAESGVIRANDPAEQTAFETDVKASLELAKAMENKAKAAADSDGNQPEDNGQ